MDAFVIAAGNLANQLLPTAGLIVLIILMVLLVRLIKFIKSLEATIKKTDTTIKLLDDSLIKVQSPLDTAVKLSNTVDRAHDATVKAVTDTKDYLSKNADNIKEKVKDLTEAVLSKNTVKDSGEPSPEDIIGGK